MKDRDNAWIGGTAGLALVTFLYLLDARGTARALEARVQALEEQSVEDHREPEEEE